MDDEARPGLDEGEELRTRMMTRRLARSDASPILVIPVTTPRYASVEAYAAFASSSERPGDPGRHDEPDDELARRARQARMALTVLAVLALVAAVASMLAASRP